MQYALSTRFLLQPPNSKLRDPIADIFRMLVFLWQQSLSIIGIYKNKSDMQSVFLVFVIVVVLLPVLTWNVVMQVCNAIIYITSICIYGMISCCFLLLSCSKCNLLLCVLQFYVYSNLQLVASVFRMLYICILYMRVWMYVCVYSLGSLSRLSPVKFVSNFWWPKKASCYCALPTGYWPGVVFSFVKRTFII